MYPCSFPWFSDSGGPIRHQEGLKSIELVLKNRWVTGFPRWVSPILRLASIPRNAGRPPSYPQRPKTLDSLRGCSGDCKYYVSARKALLSDFEPRI